MELIVITPKAAKALKKSIKHWKNIRDGLDVSEGTDNRALCKQFNLAENSKAKRIHSLGGCSTDCPIVKATDEPNCHGTPYRDFSNIVGAYTLVTSPEERVAAKKMLKFLKKIRNNAVVQVQANETF